VTKLPTFISNIYTLSPGTLATRIKWLATSFGETDAFHLAGGFRAAPRRRIEFQNFMLEWAKLRFAVVSSDHLCLAQLIQSDDLLCLDHQ